MTTPSQFPPSEFPPPDYSPAGLQPAQAPDRIVPSPEAIPAEVPTNQWRRVHPITPLMRGWFFLVALVFFIGRNLVEDFDDVSGLLTEAGWWLLLGVVVLLGLIMLVSWVSWRATRFHLDHSAFHFRSGVIFRQNRRVPLNRVQSVDINQPLLARIFGLAEVRIESAGGSDSNVELSFLRNSLARQLREEILSRTAAQTPRVTLDNQTELLVPSPVEIALGTIPAVTSPGFLPDGAPTIPDPAAEGEVLVDLPLRRLLISKLRSFTSIVFLLALLGSLAAVVAIFFGKSEGLSVLLLAAGVGASLWGGINKNYGTKVTRSSEGIRIRRGLTDLRTQNIAPGRIAALTASQPPLWRKPDWWKLTVSVAGYSMLESATRNSGELTAVATRQELELVIRTLFPESAAQLDQSFLQTALHGRDSDQWFTTSSRRARYFSALSWRRRGFAVLDKVLVIRNGRWWRSINLVEHDRSQGVSVTAGPIDRSLALANFNVHLTDAIFSVPQLDGEVATKLLRDQAERARAWENKTTTQR